MIRVRFVVWTVVALLLLAVGAFLFVGTPEEDPAPQPPDIHQVTPPLLPFPAPEEPTPAEAILDGYGDPATPPIEDLRKIHRIVTGYFSVVKDGTRNPIGGNADLAAALRGENPNRETFVRPGHPIFAKDGSIIDRWGSAIVVHPEAYRQVGLRSSGPDLAPYTADDLVLSPSGIQARSKE